MDRIFYPSVLEGERRRKSNEIGIEGSLGLKLNIQAEHIGKNPGFAA